MLGEISAGVNHYRSSDTYEKAYTPPCLALMVLHLATTSVAFT